MKILTILMSILMLVGSSLAEFLLGPADRISINVLSTSEKGIEAEPNLNGTYAIDPDGNISLHLIGSVHVTGMTPNMLRETLQTRFSEFIVHPDVTITVDQVINSRVLVLGEVRFPGVYSLSRETTAVDVLALAGGHLISALLWDVKIVRGNLAQNPTIINANLERVFKQGDLSQNVILQPGDIVFIPKTFVWRFNELLGQINPAMNTLVTGTEAAQSLR
jgi:protein involved in polysaccharide export with SLBB domain